MKDPTHLRGVSLVENLHVSRAIQAPKTSNLCRWENVGGFAVYLFEKGL